MRKKAGRESRERKGWPFNSHIDTEVRINGGFLEIVLFFAIFDLLHS